MVGASIVSAFNGNSSISSKPMDRSNWLYVGGGGPGNYTTIQSAIDTANPGDTIYVYNGIYYENVYIEKDDLHLIGEDKNTTIINASNEAGNGIFIYNCDYINISRFTIRNAQPSAGGPSQQGNGVYILAYSMGERGETANNNTLIDCIICNNSNVGVYLTAYDVDVSANNNLIQNCEISNNGLSGIYFGVGGWEGGGSYLINNKILSSKISNNGISQGPTESWGCRTGITLKIKGVITQTLISNCNLFGNHDCGISIIGSTGIQTGGENNTIIHNNFYNITNNAYDEFNNSWYDETIQEGNYWSDYTGIDANNDGIGDTPYSISGGSNQDLYPFMEQNGWLLPPPKPVHNLNTGDNFSTIQAAIDDSDTVEGNTIYVESGVYYENVNINKDEIKLMGEDKNTTIIDAHGTGDGILISLHSMNNIIISNFTIRNANGSGIIFGHPAQGTILQHNIISNCIIYNSSTNYDPDVIKGFGIVLGGHDPQMNDNSIINCDVYNNDGSGIIIFRGAYDQIRDNRIIDCKSYNNGYHSWYNWARAGITITSHYNRYIENTIISGCEVYNNAGDGFLSMNYASGTTITNNTFYNNGWHGINVSGTVHSDLIYHNNLINNGQNAYDAGTNTWYNTTIQEGNYWSDLIGIDADGDGIGDIPYNIPGGSNQDLYPFMYPNGWINQPPIANFTYTPTNPRNTTVVHFTDSSFDPDGTVSAWWWDFGDEYYSSKQNPVHCYYETGIYTVTLMVTDDDGAQSSIHKTITVSPMNYPPNIPSTPSGPTTGFTKIIYTYTTNAIDPNGDLLHYKWNWGDGTSSGWIGPYSSGILATATYKWTNAGTYQVKVKVKDIYGGESGWSPALTVKISKI